jgi:C1A family cysteine protease
MPSKEHFNKIIIQTNKKMNKREYGHHIQLNHKKCTNNIHIDEHCKLMHTVFNKVVNLPNAFSLSSKYTLNVLDQGNLGSCVANSYAAIINSLFKIMPSRLYLYFNGRVGTGFAPADDSGLDLLQSYPIFKSFGLVLETNWPYNVNNFSILPPYNSTYKIATMQNVNIKPIAQTEIAIKTELYANKFIMLGISVYTSFMSVSVAQTGIIPLPNVSKERLQGGHCIHIVGWLTIGAVSYYIIQNSWGRSWGNSGSITSVNNFKNNGSNGGFAYIPSAYILNANLAFELLSIGIN